MRPCLSKGRNSSTLCACIFVRMSLVSSYGMIVHLELPHTISQLEVSSLASQLVLRMTQVSVVESLGFHAVQLCLHSRQALFLPWTIFGVMSLTVAIPAPHIILVLVRMLRCVGRGRLCRLCPCSCLWAFPPNQRGCCTSSLSLNDQPCHRSSMASSEHCLWVCLCPSPCLCRAICVPYADRSIGSGVELAAACARLTLSISAFSKSHVAQGP